ncbi:MAG: GGDEF domain-containing protein [Lachnospiraceae bacterium]|nr:GGDEF domain-containing protein [Lachnospiraceae bacterium]
MDTKSVIEIQKKGIFMHRLVYVIFILQRLLLQFEMKDVSVRNTIYILSFIVLCEAVEEIFFYANYFNNLMVIRVVRYVQCLLATMVLVFLQISDDSEVMIIALLIMLMVDFFLAMDITERGRAVFYVICIGMPMLIVVFVKVAIHSSGQWMFLFFDILMLILVLVTEAALFVEYVIKKDEIILKQRHELTQIVEKNESILNIQEKLQKTNSQLNLQKMDLQNANSKIKEANEEMVAQAEIMHYIASSLEVPKISNQITDALMQVKKLGFCAVYIKENVYLNKHANYVIKTNIGQLQGRIKEWMEDIYLEMVAEGKMEMVYEESLKHEIPFLKDINVNSVYMKVLGIDEENYGLFMIGDQRRNLFNRDMSFYNAIIAQYDIAIKNAKIYNEMQQVARKDGLTGINNRIYFSELFKKAVDRIQQMKGCISVALFDIDKFKSVNDTYGHLAGDEVIKRIAHVAEQCIDKYNGFVCRYGGEEFVAVLPGRKLEIAQPIIDELFEDICSQVVRYNEWDITMSVSIGLTAYPEVCKNTDELLKRADWCMYYAKEHGRHQIKVDDGSIQRD